MDGVTIDRLCGAIIIRYIFSGTQSVVICTACIYIFIFDITSRCCLAMFIRCVRQGNMFYGPHVLWPLGEMCTRDIMWNIFCGHGVEHDPWCDCWSSFLGGNMTLFCIIKYVR